MTFPVLYVYNAQMVFAILSEHCGNVSLVEEGKQILPILRFFRLSPKGVLYNAFKDSKLLSTNGTTCSV